MVIDVAVIDVVGTEAAPPKMLVPAVAGTANEPNREADDTAADGCVPNELLPPKGEAFAGAASAAPLKMDADDSGVLVRTNEEPPNMLAPLAGGVAAAVAGGTVGLQTFRPWNRFSVLSATIGDNGSEVKGVFVVFVELFVFDTVVSDGVTKFSFSG